MTSTAWRATASCSARWWLQSLVLTSIDSSMVATSSLLPSAVRGWFYNLNAGSGGAKYGTQPANQSGGGRDKAVGLRDARLVGGWVEQPDRGACAVCEDGVPAQRAVVGGEQPV